MKQIKRTITELVPVGYYLVHFDKIFTLRCNEGEHVDCFDHGCVDNKELLADVEPFITKITEKNYLNLEVSVINRDETYNNDSVNGDTHDLRSRIFKTRKQANEHAKETLNKFNNPEIWQVFIKDDYN